MSGTGAVDPKPEPGTPTARETYFGGAWRPRGPSATRTSATCGV